MSKSKNGYKIITVISLLIIFILGTLNSTSFASSDTSAPTLKFTTSQSAIAKWDSAKLSRSTTNATTCKWIWWELELNKIDLDMWKIYVYPKSTKTYKMECFNSKWVSSWQKSITITVKEIKPTVSLKVSKKIINSWESVTISRIAKNATICKATWWGLNWQGAVTWFQIVSPTSTTSYSIQCFDADWVWSVVKNIKIIVKK